MVVDLETVRQVAKMGLHNSKTCPEEQMNRREENDCHLTILTRTRREAFNSDNRERTEPPAKPQTARGDAGVGYVDGGSSSGIVVRNRRSRR